MARLLCVMRKWFPASSRTYRLFDSSIVVLLISLVWYVLTTPTPITQGTVGETILGAASVRFWGLVMVVAALFSLVCVRLAKTKNSKWLDYGYGSVLLVTAGWATVLTIGALGGLFFTGVSWDATGKSLGSALWFAYACSNTAAALMREKHASVCHKCGEE